MYTNHSLANKCVQLINNIHYCLHNLVTQKCHCTGKIHFFQYLVQARCKDLEVYTDILGLYLPSLPASNHSNCDSNLVVTHKDTKTLVRIRSFRIKEESPDYFKSMDRERRWKHQEGPHPFKTHA